MQLGFKIQKNDKLHCELVKLITSGQTPEKKRTGNYYTQLKRMYNLFKTGLLKMDPNGLVIVRHVNIKGEEHDAISVPEKIYPGLMIALHIKQCHPIRLQLQRLASRYFFCLNSSKTVDRIHSNCQTCTSLTNLPKEIVHQTSSSNPGFASRFSADIIKQHQQLIFLCCKNLSQFTIKKLVPDETASGLCKGILSSVVE